MQKSKKYIQTIFSADVLREVVSAFKEALDKNKLKEDYKILSVKLEDEEWNHNTEEEFYADCRKNNAGIHLVYNTTPYSIQIRSYLNDTEVIIKAPTRTEIETFFNIFEKHLEISRLPELIEEELSSVSSPVIFIGHGGSNQWMQLKNHLQDQHGYQIEAYETGARAGHTIRDILEDMAAKSSFALLVFTAEDEQADGSFHARQNVIHETGLFQGKLGFNKAIVLLENGVKEFSNLNGIQQIRYSKGNIRETFGDVLATLKREFSQLP